MLNDNVYSYWEGPKPDIIKLCFETMEKHIPNLVVLNRRSFNLIYDNKFVKRKFLHQQCHGNINSNFIRAWLLYKYGGIWLDADFICFKDVGVLHSKLADKDFLTYRAGAFCSALIGSKPKGKIITLYLKNITKRLNTGRVLEKTKLAPSRTLTPSIRFAGSHNCYIIEQKMIHPIPLWFIIKKTDRVRMLLDTATDEEYEKYQFPNSFGFMLTHGIIKHFSKQTKDEIINGYSLISRYFKRALAI